MGENITLESTEELLETLLFELRDDPAKLLISSQLYHTNQDQITNDEFSQLDIMSIPSQYKLSNQSVLSQNAESNMRTTINPLDVHKNLSLVEAVLQILRVGGLTNGSLDDANRLASENIKRYESEETEEELETTVEYKETSTPQPNNSQTDHNRYPSSGFSSKENDSSFFERYTEESIEKEYVYETNGTRPASPHSSQTPRSYQEKRLLDESLNLSEEPTKRPRVELMPSKTHKRTKDGCWTCRVRRKKCSGERPDCIVCVHLGVQCDGFGLERPRFMASKKEQKEKRREIKRITDQQVRERLAKMRKKRTLT